MSKDDVTWGPQVGRIAFGPPPGPSVTSADLGAHRDYQYQTAEPFGDVERRPQRFVILLELFAGEGGNSLKLYWAGRSNRIEAGPRGVEVTYDVHKARQIPVGMRDVAEQLAEALNRIPVPSPEGVVNVWRAVEHGFDS